MTQATPIDAAVIVTQMPDGSTAWPWIAPACIAVILWVIAHASRKLMPAGGKR